MCMATEAMIIEGKDKAVVVEQNQAYLVRPNGKRRHLGMYVDMRYTNANSEVEEAHVRIQAWVNPNFGPIRRALLTTNINSPILPAEAIMNPPTHIFKISGPIRSRMVPMGKAA